MEEGKKLLFGITLKHLNNIDMALLKLAIITFALFLVSAWPAFANWVTNTHWAWFFGAWIIFAILPFAKAWKK